MPIERAYGCEPAGYGEVRDDIARAVASHPQAGQQSARCCADYGDGGSQVRSQGGCLVLS
jgi:hypothetical protein